MLELKTGDVLLLRKEDAPGAYTFIEKYLGKDFADKVASLEKHKYIHAEIYVGNGFILAGWFNGVKLLQPPLHYIAKFDIYRNSKMDDAKRYLMKKKVAKYFNAPYDFASLILNGIPEVLSLGFEPLERYFEKQLPYSDPSKLICSELVARLYKDIGIEIEENPEFVTPDDIAENEYFSKIF